MGIERIPVTVVNLTILVCYPERQTLSGLIRNGLCNMVHTVDTTSTRSIDTREQRSVGITLRQEFERTTIHGDGCLSVEWNDNHTSITERTTYAAAIHLGKYHAGILYLRRFISCCEA